jgi:hypothetical protein
MINYAFSAAASEEGNSQVSVHMFSARLSCGIVHFLFLRLSGHHLGVPLVKAL